jgi:hypothetical protein
VPVWNAGRQKLKVQQARLAASLVEEDYVSVATSYSTGIRSGPKTPLQQSKANWESYNTQLVSARKFYQGHFPALQGRRGKTSWSF